MSTLRLLMILAAFLLWPVSSVAETVRLAVTTSFQNSGLSDVLLPVLEAETGTDIQLLVVGTGQALRLGAAGDVDAVLVHARAAEEAFVAAGHGTRRTPIMYNDFVLVGPSDDPAGIAQAPSAAAALNAIAAHQSPFVSRGDDSGTHKAEQALWQQAARTPEGFGPWYRSVGAGMGASLNTASAMNAYILSDRASWLNFGNKGDLALLFQGDPALFNQYSFLPVNPARAPHVAAAATARIEAWLTGPEAAALIDGYRVAGAQLFTHNAADGAGRAAGRTAGSP